jgi:hypothetical protein
MTTTMVRAFIFLTRVLEGQQRDPFCRVCKARVNSVTKARERLAGFESGHATDLLDVPPEYRKMFAEAKSILAGLDLPENAVGQKKAGNCRLPEGVCFVKASLSLLEKV